MSAVRSAHLAGSGQVVVYYVCLATFGVGCRTTSAVQRSNEEAETSAAPSHTTTLGETNTTAGLALSTEVVASAATATLAMARDQAYDDIRASSIREQQQYLVRLVTEEHRLSADASTRLRQIVEKSDWLGFGNPKVSKPSMSKAECRQRRAANEWHLGDRECPAPNMVVIERNERGVATSCIDQYEFPNVACEYPVVWVRSSEAAAICQAQGKRLCDAHEWEGACAGEVLPVEEEYPWSRMPKSIGHSPWREQRLWLEYEHNRTRQVRWAYGEKIRHELCGTGAVKEPKCDVIDFGTCSSSTYPAGAFPECVSPLGVYDQHGNAAEHMNLPLKPSELTGSGGSGWTEMKGSWFIFSNQQTHPDDCRWRARSWHTTRLDEWNSHRNYHLGFRCCADVK